MSKTTQLEVDGQIPTVPVNYNLYKPIRFGKYVPMGNELEMLESAIEDGLPFLMEGEKGIGKTWRAEDLQHRPRIAVHQQRLDRRADGCKGQDQHGRQGPLDRQPDDRTTVAIAQV